MSLKFQMNTTGSAAIAITGNHSTSIASLEEASNDWFVTELDKKLSTPPIDREYTKKSPDEKPDAQAKRLKLNADIRSGYIEYNLASDQTKRSIKDKFDLRTMTGVCNLFDCKLRKQAIPSIYCEFVNDCIEYVKQGNSRLGLAKMYQSWSMSGFGMWAHITPGFALKIHLEYCKMLQSNGLNWVPRKAGHLIFKPPSGSKLAAHHDGIPPRTMIANLEEHVNLMNPSWTSWAQIHGIQALAHLDGGHNGDGSTYAIATESPAHQLAAMKLIRAIEIPGAFSRDEHQNKRMTEHWLRSDEGPYFIENLIQVLPALNAILVPRGFQKMYAKDISPDDTAGPFLAIWAMGVWHGSKANSSRRISLTLPSGPLVIADLVKMDGRLTALSVIGSSDQDIKQASDEGNLDMFDATSAIRAWAENHIHVNKTPLCDGLTHKNPQYSGDRVRHADGASIYRQTGPFQPIAPTLAETREFIRGVVP